MERMVRIGVGALCAVLFACGCGSETGGSRHAAERPTPAPAPPTPDTTPIEALRTPAGLALRIDVSSTPAPAATPTPAAATTVSAKSALESGGSTSPSRVALLSDRCGLPRREARLRLLAVAPRPTNEGGNVTDCHPSRERSSLV